LSPRLVRDVRPGRKRTVRTVPTTATAADSWINPSSQRNEGPGALPPSRLPSLRPGAKEAGSGTLQHFQRNTVVQSIVRMTKAGRPFNHGAQPPEDISGNAAPPRGTDPDATRLIPAIGGRSGRNDLASMKWTKRHLMSLPSSVRRVEVPRLPQFRRRRRHFSAASGFSSPMASSGLVAPDRQSFPELRNVGLNWQSLWTTSIPLPPSAR
jgi:hypothetical protein